MQAQRALQLQRGRQWVTLTVPVPASSCYPSSERKEPPPSTNIPTPESHCKDTSTHAHTVKVPAS